ncbi:MAG: polysulfide reductase NrfD [Flavobacteriales bacterium]|nr:polysulfide reductase NrfD [Flavobacteriales bacterium]
MFLLATTVLLIKDLDQPKRFLFVLLRPHFSSWLVKGGYALSLFGAFVSAMIVSLWLEWTLVYQVALWLAFGTATIVAIYTAFLFAQAKGRDFWQSPTLSIHMIIHSIVAGAASLSIIAQFYSPPSWLQNFLLIVLFGGVLANMITMLFELTITHPTTASSTVAHEITKGKYRLAFWLGVIAMGNVLPIGLLLTGTGIGLPVAGFLILAGLFITEKIWVEAPQRISLK